MTIALSLAEDFQVLHGNLHGFLHIQIAKQLTTNFVRIMITAGQCWRMCSVLAALSSRCAGLGDAASLPILIWPAVCTQHPYLHSSPSPYPHTTHSQIDTVQVGHMSVILKHFSNEISLTTKLNQELQTVQMYKTKMDFHLLSFA